MTLIKSISGIRGTIGVDPGESLSPLDIVKFTSAYSKWVMEQSGGKDNTVVIGRDSRISGEMISSIVSSTLRGCGINVIDLGLATTPTVEMAVSNENANGGIILTASHNPGNWNALKLLNAMGEFISAENGADILKYSEQEDFFYAEVESIGTYRNIEAYEDYHIRKILELALVDVDAIKKASLSVVVDSVNSVGGVVLPKLLESLGVSRVIGINGEPSGVFAHNPEPLPENLTQLSDEVRNSGADVGFVVDPDVDRLAIVSENGEMFNEEYTLVACSDYVLSSNPGNTVSNMSSTRALKDVTEAYGASWYTSAVGEVNVVEKMKEVDAVIGGEGNGGIIYPELHYGRDAMVGIALFLTYLSKSGLKCSELRYKYPEYVISKNRVDLGERTNPDKILDKLEEDYKEHVSSREDGLLIEYSNGWVHVRKSNTEPIIRIYSEAPDRALADKFAEEIIKSVKSLI
jgi:phosphomannomutase